MRRSPGLLSQWHDDPANPSNPQIEGKLSAVMAGQSRPGDRMHRTFLQTGESAMADRTTAAKCTLSGHATYFMSQTPHRTSSQTLVTGIKQPDEHEIRSPGQPSVIQRVEETLHKVEAACHEVGDQPQSDFQLSVIIPVFNERETLPKILDRVDEVMPEGTQTIVVDDASTDGTTEWLKTLSPRADRTILLRLRNHGKGSAVRMGLRHSRGNIVAIQDADTEYDPVDLLGVIRPIQSGAADVVYGSRYLRGSDDPSLLHRLGNWALTAISNGMTGQRLTDMETCHKAFRGDLVRSIRIKECRFGFEPEITGKIAQRGIAIAEVPTGYQYRTYQQGKKITWKDGVAALVCMWRYRNAGWLRRAFAGSGRVLIRLPQLIKGK